MKIKNHIKVQGLRNSEMRAAQGGKEYTCGGTGDDCGALVIHLNRTQADLLSVYKKSASLESATN
jgi:hypothetical protein